MSVHSVSDRLADPPQSLDGAGERDVLIAESNQRIANNLTLIAGLLRLQASDVAKAGKTLSPDEACLLLSEVGGRIETVGRLHRLLAQSGEASRINLAQYLNEVASAVVGSMSDQGVVLIQAPDAVCEVAPQQALSVAFIVGEAITNAVKYAHPAGIKGRVELSCQARPMGATLILIADDGVGLPEGFDPVRGGGLGLRVMRSIAGQLGASLSFDSDGVGLTVRLLLPPNRPVLAG